MPKDSTQHASESRLRVLTKVFTESTVPTMIEDLDGIVLDANDEAVAAYGWSREELAGNPIKQIVPEDRHGQADELLNRCRAGETVRNVDGVRQHRNGRRIPVLLTLSMLTDEQGAPTGIVTIAQDMTEQKALESRLRILTKVFSESTVPTIIEDLNGIVLDANDEAIAAYGWSREELAGNPIKQIVPEDRHGQADELLKRCRAGETVRNVDGVRQHRNGRRIPVLLTLSMLTDAQGTPKGIATIAQDMTDIKKLEDELIQSKKMEAIGKLAGGIAHDFNNILAAIIGFTELSLNDVPKSSSLKENLQEVYSAGMRAKELVKQILAFARQSEEKKSPIQLSSVVQEVMSLIRSSLPATIEIRKNIKSESFVLGNATQIHQVLMNLCTNAAYAMEEAGGILEVSLKELMIEKEDTTTGIRQGEYAEIKVSDTGTGIAPEVIGSIFEPYYTTKGPGEGTGMGLAMTRGVIETYGGKIAVDSQLGKGATFSIYLPITKERPVQGEDVLVQLPTGKERILLVEDELPLAKMYRQMLRRLGYSVTIRNSSIDALELFHAKPDDFDLVITDMTMPKLTGDKLAVELMKIRPDILVILCTGYNTKLLDEAIFDTGIKALSFKPMIQADLAITVRKVLDEAIR